MSYLIGTGIRDITGPAAEVGMMGMSNTDQRSLGILNRLFARAFVVESGGKRVAIVVTDLWSCTQAVKMAVVRRLSHLQDAAGNPRFAVENVLISGTHSHSGPGGYSHYALYNGAILGFIEQNFECIVEGVVQSIVQANSRLAPGEILVNRGELIGCGKNRSLPAYEMNPPEERQDLPSTDQEMVQLRFVSSLGQVLGVINWFPIHTTSLGETNALISGDNKGYAAYLLEQEMQAANPGFIAAFANSNCGDVSGNVDLGVPDGTHDLEHMRHFGQMQYEKASELTASAGTPLPAGVDYRHTHVDLTSVAIEGTSDRTWPAAIGVSMICGSTEDSKNRFEELGVREGLTVDNVTGVVFSEVGDLLAALMSALVPGLKIPGDAQWPAGFETGHAEKPIILAPGLATPIPLIPQILPLQLLRVGHLLIAAIPAELTTMAGRRLRQTILDHAGSLDLPPGITPQVVLTTYANAYAGYITTREEYSAQHYEGASTLFGPHSLAAYQQEFGRLASALQAQTQVAAGPEPLELSDRQINLQTGVVFDAPPLGKRFGDQAGVLSSHYLPGQTVVARFWAGHPKNDLRLEDSFLRVQRNVGQAQRVWRNVYSDRDFCTEFHWTRENSALGTSIVTIAWTIPQDTPPGTYIIRHDGSHKRLSGRISAYRGSSPEFQVVEALPDDRLFFTNGRMEDVTLRFYHPEDRIRAIPHHTQSLAPRESYSFAIPTGSLPLLGKWEGKAQVEAKEGLEAQVLAGGSHTAIS